MECWNGILLDEKNSFSLVSSSIPKVFDYFDLQRRASRHCVHQELRLLSEFEGASEATIRATESLDGILFSMYQYQDKWLLSTPCK